MAAPFKLPALPPRPHDDSAASAMYDIADALRYPVDSRGRVYDVTFLAPIIAYHLARAGAVINPERAVIKPRPLRPGPGIADGAIQWVAIDAPDEVADELAGVTVDDIDTLSPAARAELIRRLGGDTSAIADADGDNLDDRTPWRVEPSIRFDDDEEH